MYRQIRDDETIADLVGECGHVVLLFGSESCGPCHALARRLETWAARHEDVCVRYVALEERVAEASQAGILSAPTVCAYIDGDLYLREGGYFSLDLLLERYEELLRMSGE